MHPDSKYIMDFTIEEIARSLQGTTEGNTKSKITGLSKIDDSKSGTISFLANPKYESFIYSTKASAVIVSNDFKASSPVACTLIRVQNVEKAFADLLEKYNQIKLNKKGISQKAHISSTAALGKDLYIGEFCVIGENVKIGDNAKIYPGTIIGDHCVIGNNTTLFSGVKIYSDNILGNNCIIHSGTVIGSDGFRFALDSGSKVPQTGNVILEDNVEIGANCAIDRATLGSTIIRKGVKMDNLVHIAHNVEIGDNTYIAAHCVIAGSTKVGRNCMMSGQVGIVGHLKIADNTIMAAQAGISKSITKPGAAYLGSPAFEINKYRKAYIHFKNLESIVERLEKLEKGKKD